MKDRNKRLTPKKAASARKPVTGSISPQAKSGSILPNLLPEEVLLPKKIGSLTPAQAIRAYGETLSQLQGRYRKLRRVVLTGVYTKGAELMTNKKEYKEFLADPFWKKRRGEGPKPGDQKEAVRFAIIRALNAKEEDQNKRATRDGNAFQQLANEGVQPENLWKVVKERGGRDALAKKYVASKRPESSKSAHEEEPEPKLLSELLKELATQPEAELIDFDFNWDLPGLRCEVISLFVGVRDGKPLFTPSRMRVISKSLPDAKPDPVAFKDVKRVSEIKSKKPKK